MKPSGGSGGTQTTTTNTQLPDWINQQAQSNLRQANTVAGNLQPTQVAPVAGMTSGQTSAIGGLTDAVGGANPGYNAAQQTLQGLQGFNPSQVTPGSIAGSDMSKYMNPYTQSVINSAIPLMEQQRKLALAGVGDASRGAKAFGGSRQGVMEGVTNAQSNLNEGQLASQLQSQNFLQAQGAAGQDVNTNLQGQVANQNAGISGAGVQNAAAANGANVAGGQQGALLQSLMASLQGNSLFQQQQQNVNNQGAAQTNANNQNPVNQLQILEQALAGTPYGSTTTQQTSLPAGNGLASGLGAGLGILGSLGSMFGQNGAFPVVGSNSVFNSPAVIKN